MSKQVTLMTDAIAGNGKQGQERGAKEWRYLVRWAYF